MMLSHGVWYQTSTGRVQGGSKCMLTPLITMSASEWFVSWQQLYVTGIALGVAKLHGTLVPGTTEVLKQELLIIDVAYSMLYDAPKPVYFAKHTNSVKTSEFHWCNLYSIVQFQCWYSGTKVPDKRPTWRAPAQDGYASSYFIPWYLVPGTAEVWKQELLIICVVYCIRAL